MWILNQNRDCITNGKIMYYIEKITYYDKPEIPLYPEKGYYIYIDNSSWRIVLGQYETEEKVNEAFTTLVESLISEQDSLSPKYFEMPKDE